MTLAPRSHFVAAVRHAPSLTSQRSYSRRTGPTALQIAIRHGDKYPYTDTALAEYLRSVGAHMSIHDAAFFGDVAVVQECLLANPACINEKRSFAPPMQLMFMTLLVCRCAASPLSSTALIALPCVWLLETAIWNSFGGSSAQGQN